MNRQEDKQKEQERDIKSLKTIKVFINQNRLYTASGKQPTGARRAGSPTISASERSPWRLPPGLGQLRSHQTLSGPGGSSCTMNVLLYPLRSVNEYFDFCSFLLFMIDVVLFCPRSCLLNGAQTLPRGPLLPGGRSHHHAEEPSTRL